MPFHVKCSGQGFLIRGYLFKDQRKQERDITREKVFQAERSERAEVKVQRPRGRGIPWYVQGPARSPGCPNGSEPGECSVWWDHRAEGSPEHYQPGFGVCVKVRIVLWVKWQVSGVLGAEGDILRLRSLLLPGGEDQPGLVKEGRTCRVLELPPAGSQGAACSFLPGHVVTPLEISRAGGVSTTEFCESCKAKVLSLPQLPPSCPPSVPSFFLFLMLFILFLFL